MKPYQSGENRDALTVTQTADGRTIALMLNPEGFLMGALYQQGGEVEWKLLDETKMQSIHIALHARDGRMVAVGKDAEGKLLHRWFEPDAMADWAWSELDGVSKCNLQLVERATGGIELFRIDEEGKLWHRWSNKEFKWSDWDCLGNSDCVYVCVANNKEGFPQAYVRRCDGSIAVKRHLNNGTWNDWKDLGGNFCEGPKCQVDCSGWVHVVAEANGAAMVCVQTEIDEYGAWENA